MKCKESNKEDSYVLSLLSKKRKEKKDFYVLEKKTSNLRKYVFSLLLLKDILC